MKAKFSDLSAQDQDEIIIKQMSHESPGMLKELSKLGIVDNEGINYGETQQPKQEDTTYEPEKESLYKKFNEDGILPSGMKLTSPAGKKFMQEAKAYSDTVPKEVDPKKQAQIIKIQEHFD